MPNGAAPKAELAKLCLPTLLPQAKEKNRENAQIAPAELLARVPHASHDMTKLPDQGRVLHRSIFAETRPIIHRLSSRGP